MHDVACRLPETSTLLTYLILDRKGLVSGSDFPYLSVCRRSVAPCSGRDDVEAEVLVLRLVAGYGSEGSALLHVDVLQCVGAEAVRPAKLRMVVLKVTCLQSATVYPLYRRRQAAYGDVEGDLSAVRNSLPLVLLKLGFLFYLNALYNTPCY